MNDISINLNRVHLPITGFMQRYKGTTSEGAFRDVTSTPFIIEAMVAHSAWEIVVSYHGPEYQERILKQLPEVLSKRLRFIDKDRERELYDLVQKVLYPVFDEFAVKPILDGYGIEFKKGLDDKTSDSIATVYGDFITFVLGLKFKSEIDIDILKLKVALNHLKQVCRSTESRGNISVFQSILNSYHLADIANLTFKSRITQKQLNPFLNFLDDVMFQELAKESYLLGLPLIYKKAAKNIKQLVRKITSSEKFEPLFEISSHSIATATQTPLPTSGLLNLITTSSYLPPIVSMSTILSKARQSWKSQVGESNIPERYQESTGEILKY